MFQAIQRLRNRDRQDGFTLIELMVVVMIIAILVGIAVPAFFSARKRAHDTSARSSLQISLSNAQAVYTETQAYPATADLVTALVAEEPNIDFVDAATASTGPKVISLQVSTSTVAGASTNDQLILASKSASGKCFYIRHVATPGDASLSGTYVANQAVAGAVTCSGGDTVAAWTKA